MREVADVIEVEAFDPRETEAVQGYEVEATPYRWRDPAALPRRPWVYGRWFLRGTVACVVAPGGAGKSTMLAGTALALVVAQPLLGKHVWGGPKKVWLWNLEDDLDEMSRSIQAAALHHGIERRDVEGRLFVDSAMEGAGLCTATEEAGQFRLLTPVYAALTAELQRRQIDVLIVDPFVSSHEVDENANSKADKIAKAWGRVAKSANCCIVLVHHTSKAGAAEVTALSSRGAVGLTDASRCTLVINRMQEAEASRLGIPDEERSRYISVSDDKHNRTPAEKADWYRRASVDLGNGDDGAPGDNMAVLVPWSAPDPFEDVTVRHLIAVQSAINAGRWRENWQSPDWAGNVVADVLKLNVEKKADVARVRSLLKIWIYNKALVVVERADSARRVRKWIETGEPAIVAPPARGGAEQGGAT